MKWVYRPLMGLSKFNVCVKSLWILLKFSFWFRVPWGMAWHLLFLISFLLSLMTLAHGPYSENLGLASVQVDLLCLFPLDSNESHKTYYCKDLKGSSLTSTRRSGNRIPNTGKTGLSLGLASQHSSAGMEGLQQREGFLWLGINVKGKFPALMGDWYWRVLPKTGPESALLEMSIDAKG